MKRTFLIGLVGFALSAAPDAAHAQTQTGDSPQTLEWVQKISNTLEERLKGAVAAPTTTILLVKLMESFEDFEAVALMGLYCQNVRVAAEEGRNQCNWLTSHSQEKDLNTLIQRAQNARAQALKMREASALCLQEAKLHPPDQGFTCADIIRSNAEAIQHDLSDGLASQNFHILSQKIEHAERIFHDTEVLALRLNNCETVRNAAREGIQACVQVLASPNWSAINAQVQQASAHAAKIKERAAECR
jgi:hypothetical protein